MASFTQVRSPLIAVDVIIENGAGEIVLVQRKSPPQGWAMPGGFVDYGETLWQAAVREAKEETSLIIELVEQFYTYSDPQRDSRCHTVTTVFIALASGKPVAQDDAQAVGLFRMANLPPLAFDHSDVLKDYANYKEKGIRPGPVRKYSRADMSLS